MRTALFCLLRNALASRFAMLRRQRHSAQPALSAAEERALFTDAEALAQAQQRFGLHPASWGRLLATLLLTSSLLLSTATQADDNSPPPSSEQSDSSSLVEILLDAMMSVLGDDEGGSGDPGAGQ